MVHVKNYETVSVFVKLCLVYCRLFFSGHGVYSDNSVMSGA